eukprot:5695977-Alexandrium_andersonii.AAC.1
MAIVGAVYLTGILARVEGGPPGRLIWSMPGRPTSARPVIRLPILWTVGVCWCSAPFTAPGRRCACTIARMASRPC